MLGRLFRGQVRRAREAGQAGRQLEQRRRSLRRPPLLPVRQLVLGGLALTALLLVAALVGSTGSGGRQQQARVVVASVPISQGTRVSPDMVAVVSVPASRVPPGAFSSPQEVVGRTAARPLIPGEPLTESAFAGDRGPGQGAPGGTDFPAGMQAVSVVVQEHDAVMGRVQRGDRVDILATFYQPAPVTRVLVRAAPVLAVSQVEMDGQASRSQQPGGSPARQKIVVLTVLVPSELVPDVVLGQHAGRVAVSVRPSSDSWPTSGTGPGEKSGVSVQELTSGHLPQPQGGPASQVLSPVAAPVRSDGALAPRRTDVAVPPVPSLPPAQTREQPERGGASPSSAWVVSAPDRPDRALSDGSGQASVSVEVIRGVSVSLEQVPHHDAMPNAGSVASRSRQEGRPGRQGADTGAVQPGQVSQPGSVSVVQVRPPGVQTEQGR